MDHGSSSHPKNNCGDAVHRLLQSSSIFVDVHLFVANALVGYLRSHDSALELADTLLQKNIPTI
jgi:hypothetical protein